MNRDLMNRPAAGTIRIVTPHGTFTIPEARFDVIHRSGWPDSVPSQTVEVAGPTAHFRPHWRHRWAHGLRNAERNERVSRPMERVTRVAYRRAGVFGLEFMTQFNDQGEDTNWRLRLDLPFLSLSLNVSRPRFRRGDVSLGLGSLTIQHTSRFRQLTLSPLKVWSYPYGDRREWGVSLGRINGASLFLYANAEEGQGAPRVDVCWCHLSPRARGPQ